MNALDYGILVSLVGFLIYGCYRGFLRQAFVIVGLGAAFFLAAKFHTDLAAMDFLKGLRERTDSVALVGSFLVIFFATAAVTSMIASWLGGKLQSDELKSGNRVLGGLLGLGLGAIIIGGVCLGLKEWAYPNGAVVPDSQQGEVRPGLITDSLLVPKMADACLALVAVIPQEQREQLTKLYEEKIYGKTQEPGGESNPWGDLLHSSFKESEGAIPRGANRNPAPLLDLGGWHNLASRFDKEEEKKPKVDEK